MIRCDAKGCVNGILRCEIPGHENRGSTCQFCFGQGEVSLRRVALYLQVNEGTLRKILRNCPVRASVAAKIVNKLTKLLDPTA